MIEAIASMLSKTFDAWLKINSAESRKRRFARDIFHVYCYLGAAADSLEHLEGGLRELVNRPHNTWWVNQCIAQFSSAIGKISSVLGAEAMDLTPPSRQPEKLQVLGIHDPDFESAFLKAWRTDGGFVVALDQFGLHENIDGKVLKLLDGHFDPSSSRFGYEIEPVETEYSWENQDQMDQLIEKCEQCRKSVEQARDAARQFLATRCSIEDLL